MNASPSAAGRFSSALLAVLIGILVVLLFVAIYLVQPGAPFRALLEMGVVALVLGLVSYLGQALSRDPSVQRALGWGLGAAGFALLLGTIWVGPAPSSVTLTWRVFATIPVLLVLILTVALAWWRFQSTAVTERRVERRAAWDQSRPPSAFEYAAAQSPGTTPGGTPTGEPAPGGSAKP